MILGNLYLQCYIINLIQLVAQSLLNCLFFIFIYNIYTLIILYFTLLIMSCEKIELRAILCNMWKNGVSARAVTKDINDMEGQGTVNKCVAQNWFRHFKEDDTSPMVISETFCCERNGVTIVPIRCYQNLVLHNQKLYKLNVVKRH